MSNLSYEPLKNYAPYPNKKKRFIIILFLIIIAATISIIFYSKSKNKDKQPKNTTHIQQKQVIQEQKVSEKTPTTIRAKSEIEEINVGIQKLEESQKKQIPQIKKTIEKKVNKNKETDNKPLEKIKTPKKTTTNNKIVKTTEISTKKTESKKSTMPILDEAIINLNIAEASQKQAKRDKFIKAQQKILSEAEALYKNKDYFGVHQLLAKVVNENNFYTNSNNHKLQSIKKNSKDSEIVSDKKLPSETTELTLDAENKKKNAEGKLPFELWLKMARLYSKANTKTFFSSKSFSPFDKTIYKVKRGDALQKIAKKFKTTITAVQKQNGMNKFNYNIRIGENLNIYNGNWHIIVNKSKFLLMLYDKSQLFAIYNIALGKNNKTPIGNFKIISKVIEPDWYSKSEKISYGDERNVLGTRWMEIKSTDDKNHKLRGYGIHGTWERNSINKMRSNGCIRMLNENVEELFDIIPINTPIKITE